MLYSKYRCDLAKSRELFHQLGDVIGKERKVFSKMLFDNIKIKQYKTIAFPDDQTITWFVDWKPYLDGDNDMMFGILAIEPTWSVKLIDTMPVTMTMWAKRYIAGTDAFAWNRIYVSHFDPINEPWLDRVEMAIDCFPMYASHGPDIPPKSVRNIDPIHLPITTDIGIYNIYRIADVAGIGVHDLMENFDFDLFRGVSYYGDPDFYLWSNQVGTDVMADYISNVIEHARI